MSGANSGIGKGFAILLAVVTGVIAVVALFSLFLGSFFDSAVVKIACSALLPVVAAYLFYQPRLVCFFTGGSGVAAYYAAAYAAAAVGTGLGALVLGGVAGIITFVVAFLVGLLLSGKLSPGADSWRKSKTK